MLKMLDQEIERTSFSVYRPVSISGQSFVFFADPDFPISRKNNYASGILQFYTSIVLHQFFIGTLSPFLFSISP